MRKGWTTYWNTTSRAFQLWNYFVSIRYKPALSGNLRGLVHNNVSCCFLRRTCQERRDASYLYFAEKFSIVVVCVRCPCDPVPSLWEFFKHKTKKLWQPCRQHSESIACKEQRISSRVISVLFSSSSTSCFRSSAENMDILCTGKRLHSPLCLISTKPSFMIEMIHKSLSNLLGRNAESYPLIASRSYFLARYFHGSSITYIFLHLKIELLYDIHKLNWHTITL